jgi:Amt family ammonium transporter
MTTIETEQSPRTAPIIYRRFPIYLIILLVIGIAVGYAATFFAGASAGSFNPKLINSGDTAWVLTSAAMVLLMTPAVGFFYGGMVTSKNVVSVIKQTLLILAIVSIQWVLVGYSLVFGKDFHGIIGELNFFGLAGVGYAPNADYAGTIPQLAFMIFQAMFAIITPALIIGSFVERIRFRTLVLFVILWSTLVYDPIAHWVWGAGGWLHNLGALDFAGGAVVHISAGFAGLAAAIVIGKRRGFQRGEAIVSNNVPFVLLGAGLLWFGWFGFNAGSALAASPLAVSAFVVTNTAGATAALVWLILSWAENKKPSALATATGAVCGLAAITPASGFVGPIASIAIGIIAGLMTYLALHLRSKRTLIDDTLDVWAAHGMGGVTGIILTGVFAEKAINGAGNNGLLFGNPGLLGTQILTALVTLVYAFVVTFILFKVLAPLGLRVSPQEEEDGLDLAIHGEEGYRLTTIQVEIDGSATPEAIKAEERIAQLEAGTAELCLQLETENSELRHQLKTETAELRLQLEVENSELRQQLQTETAELRQRLEATNSGDHITQLQAENGELHHRLEVLNSELRHRLEAENTELRQRLEAANSEDRITQLQAENGELRQQLQEILAQIKELAEQLTKGSHNGSNSSSSDSLNGGTRNQRRTNIKKSEG